MEVLRDFKEKQLDFPDRSGARCDGGKLARGPVRAQPQHARDMPLSACTSRLHILACETVLRTSSIALEASPGCSGEPPRWGPMVVVSSSPTLRRDTRTMHVLPRRNLARLNPNASVSTSKERDGSVGAPHKLTVSNRPAHDGVHARSKTPPTRALAPYHPIHIVRIFILKTSLTTARWRVFGVAKTSGGGEDSRRPISDSRYLRGAVARAVVQWIHVFKKQ
jgi:hypothetical protein